MSPTREPVPCHIEELGHTAEIGFYLRAPTQAALFTCAMVALFQIMRSGPPQGSTVAEEEITLESTDSEALLVDWLNELLYLYETNHAVFTARILEIKATSLRASVCGRRPAHPADVHIKAVTYHQLRVEETAAGWEAQVFVDI